MIDAQRVSVVIPAYNHEDYIEETVRSVTDQTCRIPEIIIIDDGSIDRTGDICTSLAKKNRTIRYVRQDNQGAHITLNRGIQQATGDYIAVLNSDDCFLPNKIERCLNLVKEDPALDLICGHVNFIDAKGVIQKSGISTDWQKRAYDFFALTENLAVSLLNENFVTTTSNMFFSKELWKENGGFQPLRYCHDLDFLMSSSRNGKILFDMDTPHIKYRVHKSNTIKEDLSKIRVEIAAVMAVSFVLDNGNLLSPSKEMLVYFKKFLKNKNLSDLVLVLITTFLSSRDRSAFYEALFDHEAKRRYSILLD